MQLLPLGRCDTPDRIITTATLSRDAYPDGKKWFNVLDCQDVPMSRQDIPTHFIYPIVDIHCIHQYFQISSGLDANCLFRSFLTLVPVTKKL